MPKARLSRTSAHRWAMLRYERGLQIHLQWFRAVLIVQYAVSCMQDQHHRLLLLLLLAAQNHGDAARAA
jgi:hypothetical protein